ncbi:MAG TPA: hypothetical protein VKN18_19635 [Blastocatellia bacterium]|nr:hypothetical protein [Blastocatellia bacterium]
MKIGSRLFVVTMLTLQCVSGFFILAAAYSFIVGLWHLLIFVGGLLFYGFVVMRLGSFPEQLGRAIFNLVGPLLFGAVGALGLAIARRMRARLNLANQAADRRAPVVYLRSFHFDKRLARRPLAIGRVFSIYTEEEQLVQAVHDIGPVVAVGRPGERLPRLGAQRVYLEDIDWHQQILSWFARAALVIIHVPPKLTEGVSWEIEQSLNVVMLDRLVFLISRDVSSFDWLNRKIQERGLILRHVSRLPRAPYGSRASGIVYFVNGGAEFRALAKPPFFQRPFFSPLVPVYRSALQSVTTRITGSWPPLSPGFGDAIIAAIWITFFVLVIAAALYLRRTNPLEREIMICGERLMQQLPAESRQLATTRGDALYGWMQTQIHRGLRYVPDDVARARADVLRRLLAIAPLANCAAAAKGAVPPQALDRLFNELAKQDPASLKTWCSCQERALLESLKSTHTRAFQVSEADAAAAFADLYTVLSEEDRTQFHRIATGYEQASADDHCWFTRAILEGAEKVREPSRSRLARIGQGQEIE